MIFTFPHSNYSQQNSKYIFHPIRTECGFVSMNTTTNSEIDAINKFILYSVEETQSWVALYKEKRREWGIDIKEFRWLHSRRIPFLDHLKENMPMMCPNNWVSDQIREKYGSSIHYPPKEGGALNIGIKCKNSVIKYFLYIYNFIMQL